MNRATASKTITELEAAIQILSDREARAREVVGSGLDRNRSALAHESISADRLFQIKEDMQRPEARRLRPYSIRSFFLKAFDLRGGTIYRREPEWSEITHVPAAIRERDRRILGRNLPSQSARPG